MTEHQHVAARPRRDALRAQGSAEHVHPTQDDAVVGLLSESVGGPAGTRMARPRWWTPVRVLLALTALTFALGMVQKAGCADRDWQGENYRYTHMCYSDIPYLYTWRGLADGHWPFTGDPEVRAQYEVMEYPAGITYWAWGTAKVTTWLSGSPEVGDPERNLLKEGTLYTAVNAIGFALVGLLTTWIMARVHRRRPWDAAGWAVAPAVVLTGIMNWDLLAVVFVAGACWAWARGKPLATGVMIGVGTAVKLYPFLLLGVVLVLCLRARRWTALALAFAGAAAAWLLVNLPGMVTGFEQWKVFWRFNSERGSDLGSIWLVAEQAFDTTYEASTINLLSWAFVAVCCAGVLALGLKASVPPRFAQLAFLVVAAFLVINKVYSPQYVLWLLPLAVLARPRWRDLLIWQACEAVYFAATWWYLGDLLSPGSGGDPLFYWLAVLVRIGGQAWFASRVVRDVLHPEHDPVVADRLEDAESASGLAAGPSDDAPGTDARPVRAGSGS